MARARPNALGLTVSVMSKLREHLPAVAVQTLAAVMAEVPGYAGTLDETMRSRIEDAVRMALGGFLNVASRTEGSDPSSPLAPVLDAAYALGRGEARSGRSTDTLSAAYRVGARVAWRELAGVAVTARVPARTVAQFAELVFAYIDELSAASVSGHADELTSTGRVRQRHLDRLARALLAGEPAGAVAAAADRAEWAPPQTLAAVVLPESQVRGVGSLIDPRTLVLSDELPGAGVSADAVVLLIPDVDGLERARLRRLLVNRQAVLGPSKPWMQVQVSFERAVRASALNLPTSAGALVDTEEHLVALVLGADAEAMADLRAQVLTPLAALRPSTAEKLADTLRLWLLHQGRREEVAAALFVHPQTVRYRLGQLRELYGDRLEDPNTALAMSIALEGEVTRG